MKHSNYINRELSWLAFNNRVLGESNCATTPLLERVKFLAITANNLDEFFMVRVGGLMMVSENESESVDIVGLNASQQLSLIRRTVLEMYKTKSAYFNELESELAKHNIQRLTGKDLGQEQRKFARDFFANEVLSSVAPIAVKADFEFPMLFGTRLCICVRLAGGADSMLERAKSEKADQDSDERFVVIPLGSSLPRIVGLPCATGYEYILIEDLIAEFIEDLYGKDEILELTPFRITRNADIQLGEDDTFDLLDGMQKMLLARRKGGCVRFEVAESCSKTTRQFLMESLSIEKESVYVIDGPINFAAFFALASIKGFHGLRDEAWPPQAAPGFHSEKNVFDVIAEGDQLLHHPYQSYDPVVDFLKTASTDPGVIAIKQTLYRIDRDSSIASALIAAAENGKHVTVVVELKARFDEARNIYWAKRLEQAGVDVIYGVRGLKTHAKVCIVVRREATGLQRYVHFGTGNYNESTATLYTDVSLFTCDEELGRDAVHIFNAITGLSVPQNLTKLAAAPINLRETVMDLIAVEIENAKTGEQGEIKAKLNSLTDRKIINALYEASQAGVKVSLSVRGICCLRAGVPGLSENIRVVSVIDRMLEHARVYYFRQGGDDRLFIASADWMGRNLDRRVELMVPVEDEDCKKSVLTALELALTDNVKGQELYPDNSYRPLKRRKGDVRIRSQEINHDTAVEAFQAFTNPRTTVFKPHRGESA